MLHEENQPTTVDQLIYTWSAAGLNGQPGYGVRAASRGLSDLQSQRYQKLSPYLPYELPPGAHAGHLVQEEAPVCLAFLRGESGRILLHKQYTGADALGREGVYVTHLLADLPSTFSAREAILLWHAHAADLWITSCDAVGPQILEPVALTRLTELQQQAWHSFSLAARPPALHRTLALFLQDYPPGRVYLCGQATAIALTIWCITQSLPRRMLKGLTFTTYEDHVAYSKETIVGLAPSQSVPSLPPGFFYVDLAAPEPLPITLTPAMETYLDFALRQLAARAQSVSGPGDQLTAFLTQADEQAVEHPTALLSLFEQSQARLQPPPVVIGLPPTQPPPQRPPAGARVRPPVSRPPATLRERLPHTWPSGRVSGLQASLLLNALLLLCVVVLLLFRAPGPQSAALSPTQQTQTATVLHSNDVRLALVGVMTRPDPVAPGQALHVTLVIANQGPATWTARQGLYFVCVPASGHALDRDCQVITGGRQQPEPENQAVQMERIPTPGGISVSPASFSFLTFSLQAQPLGKSKQPEIHHIILRIGQGSRLLPGSIIAYFTVQTP